MQQVAAQALAGFLVITSASTGLAELVDAAVRGDASPRGSIRPMVSRTP
jgi:hypothetical protein